MFFFSSYFRANNFRETASEYVQVRKLTNVNFALMQNLSAISETKGPFLWKYFDHMSFFLDFCENICFRKYFRENTGKVGAKGRNSLKKLAVFV